MNKNLIPWRRKREAGGEGLEVSHPFELLHRQMNDLFENFFEDSGLSRLPSVWHPERGISALSPRFDVAETDDEIQVTAELPGMDEKDIQVTLEDNVLTVRGEKKEEREEKKKNYYLSERSYGEFRRVVPLPAGIDENKVKARFSKGVLKVSLPKTEQARKQGKHIEISGE